MSGGDIVKALTTGKPRITPLADPFGEAICYTPDGKLFVTVSDGGTLDDSDPIDILSYTPSTVGAEALPNWPARPAHEAGRREVLARRAVLDDITYLIGAVGVIGALLVGAGVFGILRSRRKPRPPAAERPSAAEPDGERSGRRTAAAPSTGSTAP